MVEQVSKQWNHLAKLAWAEKTTFGTNNIFNRCNIPITLERFLKILDCLLTKKLTGSNIKKLSLMELGSFKTSSKFFSECMRIIAENCPNLESICLEGFFSIKNPSRFPEAEFLQLKNLKSLKLLDCKPIKDEFIRKLFQSNSLETVEVSGSKYLTGEFLTDESLDFSKLKEVNFSHCKSLREEHVIKLLERIGGNLTKFCVEYTLKKMSQTLFDAIIKHAPQVENLSCLIRFSKPTRLSTLTNLVYLDISWSRGIRSNYDLANMLNSCKNLKHLNLADCGKEFLGNEAFTLFPIRAPLRYLNIDGYKGLGDATLNALQKYLVNTLEELVIGETKRFSVKAIVSLIETLAVSKLKHLNLAHSKYLGSADFLNKVVESLEPMRQSHARNVFSINVESSQFLPEKFTEDKHVSEWTRKSVRESEGDFYFQIKYRNLVVEYFDDRKQSEFEDSLEIVVFGEADTSQIDEEEAEMTLEDESSSEEQNEE
jgi:hypothetical protein